MKQTTQKMTNDCIYFNASLICCVHLNTLQSITVVLNNVINKYYSGASTILKGRKTKHLISSDFVEMIFLNLANFGKVLIMNHINVTLWYKIQVELR